MLYPTWSVEAAATTLAVARLVRRSFRRVLGTRSRRTRILGRSTVPSWARQTGDVHSLLGSLGLGIVVMTVTLGTACGGPESALRAEGQVRSSTVATSTALAGRLTTIVPATSSTTAPVPVTTSTTTPAGTDSLVKGTVLFSPVCPVERIPPDPQCAPRPGVADIQLVRPNGTVAAQGRAGSDGQFSVVVAPGTYAVRAAAPAAGPGTGCQVEPAQVTVVARAVELAAVRCDTGIR